MMRLVDFGLDPYTRMFLDSFSECYNYCFELCLLNLNNKPKENKTNLSKLSSCISNNKQPSYFVVHVIKCWSHHWALNVQNILVFIFWMELKSNVINRWSFICKTSSFISFFQKKAINFAYGIVHWIPWNW